MPLFMGLDCGGTTTRVRVEDEEGQVVFEGNGGPANISLSKETDWKASLVASLEGAPKVDAVAGCFAGLLGKERERAAVAALNDLVRSSVAAAYPDYVATLEAAPAGTDVVVVSGTGSVVCGWREGEVVKVGGGGPWLGDFGSAFDVGRYATRLYCSGVVDVEKAPELAAGLLATIGTQDPVLIPVALQASTSPATALASLAPHVARDAHVRRAYALVTVGAAMRALSDQVVSLLVETKDDVPRSLRIGLAGGLWDAGNVYQARFAEMFEDRCVEYDLIGPDPRQYHVERMTAPPVQGAVKLARRQFYGH